MADPRQQGNLNTLLKWSIENSGDQPAELSGNPDAPRTHLTPDVLNAIMGGPSDADLMKASMATIQDPSISLDDKVAAFDNFEQLVEGIDNANNMGALDLWQPLLDLLGSPEPKLRFMAAWCIGTAVQNNEKAQETAVTMGAMPKLVALVTGRAGKEQRAVDSAAAGSNSAGGQDDDDEKGVRRKACYAISSAVRNYQPAARAVTESLPPDLAAKYKGLDASDMEAVTALIDELRAYGDQ